MAESATYFSELVPSNVDSSQDPTDGGAQLRVIKDTIVNTCGSFDAAITATSAEVNYLDITTLGTAEASKALTIAADSTYTLNGMTCADGGAFTTIDINGGTINGITDLAIADGGTGASDAATARTNLGISVGSDVQEYNAGLADIAALAVTDGNFIVGDGANWVAESGATARTSLGLGSIATQASSSVSITGGSITGITDLAIADGGTGASDEATARSNLGIDALARYQLQGVIANAASAETAWVAVGVSGDITRFDTVIEGQITGTAATVTLQTSAGTTIASVTIATGGAAGDVDSDTSPANTAVTAGTALKVVNTGGSTGAQRVWFTITVDNS